MGKERLEEIKGKYSEVTVLKYINDIEVVGVDIKDLVWLINRVEELELEVNNWREEVRKWQKFYEESEESHSETLGLLHSTTSITKRYREYLELIKTIGTYGKDISTGEIIRSDEANLAEEALEECK